MEWVKGHQNGTLFSCCQRRNIHKNKPTEKESNRRGGISATQRATREKEKSKAGFHDSTMHENGGNMTRPQASDLGDMRIDGQIFRVIYPYSNARVGDVQDDLIRYRQASH